MSFGRIGATSPRVVSAQVAQRNRPDPGINGDVGNGVTKKDVRRTLDSIAGEWARKGGDWKVASDLLRNYTAGDQPSFKSKMRLSWDWMMRYGRAREGVKRLQGYFEKKALQVAKENKARLDRGETVTFDDNWDAQIEPPYNAYSEQRDNPHFWALGTFTISARGRTSIKKGSDGKLQISIDADFKGWDRYDFERKPGTAPTDAVDYGFAKEFDVEVGPKSRSATYQPGLIGGSFKWK